MPRVSSFTITPVPNIWRVCQYANCHERASAKVRWIVADGRSAGHARVRFLCAQHTRRWLDTHFEQHQLFPA